MTKERGLYFGGGELLFSLPPFKWWARPKNVFSSSKKRKNTLKINH